MRALILLYHRVAHGGADPWSMCVTPERFSEQMEALRMTAHPCTLAELVRAHQAGRLPDSAVAVTFDDGYLDNLTNAKPILARCDIPATVFVCSGSIGRKEEFWWDELERAFFQNNGIAPQAQLVIETPDQCFHWDFDNA